MVDGRPSRPGRHGVSRRTFVVGAAVGAIDVALAGCSGRVDRPTATEAPMTTTADNPAMGDVTPTGGLELTSPAFADGGPIPREYGRHERDVNPPLRFAGVPADAASLALVMDDPDALEPAGRVWLHWLVWNVDPATTDVPTDWQPTGAVEGVNSFGERGYGGPAPPDRVHTYRFKGFALDRRLDLPPSAAEADVGSAMAGHVLAADQLEGTYAP